MQNNNNILKGLITEPKKSAIKLFEELEERIEIRECKDCRKEFKIFADNSWADTKTLCESCELLADGFHYYWEYKLQIHRYFKDEKTRAKKIKELRRIIKKHYGLDTSREGW